MMAVELSLDQMTRQSGSGISALHGPAWPESRGFGLARAGFGFVKSQARPKPPVTAWLRLGLAQAAAFVSNCIVRGFDPCLQHWM